MDRLTVPDERIEGGTRRAIIDAREVRKEAMTIYWQLKKYEDIGLTPDEIIDLITILNENADRCGEEDDAVLEVAKNLIELARYKEVGLKPEEIKRLLQALDLVKHVIDKL